LSPAAKLSREELRWLHTRATGGANSRRAAGSRLAPLSVDDPNIAAAGLLYDKE
jgi:hypothetical protein